MTLVIAGKCKQGIVVSSDGKASRWEVRGTENKGIVEDLENCQKIFQLHNHVSVLVYGMVANDFELSLLRVANVVGNPDMEYCKNNLPRILSQLFLDEMRADDVQGGVIVAGYTVTHGKAHSPEIISLESKYGFACREFGDYLAAGEDEMAVECLSKVVGIAQLEAKEVASVSHQIIEATADKHPDTVNKNIVQWLITPDGVKQL